MILDIWNNLRGYITIEVTGFSVERFVNLVVYNGIYIWDISYSGNGVTMKVSIKGFKLLRKYARKTGCKIKVVEKNGYPFVVNRYRKRKFLLGGILFFIITMYALSSFIWLIEIKGTKRIENEKILELCEENGFKIGSLKYSLKKKDLEKIIQDTFKDVSFVSISIKGTRSVINISETIEKVDHIDKTEPCDVVAKKDGLISSIITMSGTPVVKIKDVVEEGDILVTSEIIVKENELGLLKDYTHAEAEVKAKLYYEINFKVPFNYEEKKYTDEIEKNYHIKILDKEIDVFNQDIVFENYDKTISRKQLSLTKEYPLPIIIFSDEYKKFDYIERTRNIEQAKEMAEKITVGRIIRELDVESDVVDKKYEYTQEVDGLKVKATISTIERIDEKRVLN